MDWNSLIGQIVSEFVSIPPLTRLITSYLDNLILINIQNVAFTAYEQHYKNLLKWYERLQLMRYIFNEHALVQALPSAKIIKDPNVILIFINNRNVKRGIDSFYLGMQDPLLKLNGLIRGSYRKEGFISDDHKANRAMERLLDLAEIYDCKMLTSAIRTRFLDLFVGSDNICSRLKYLLCHAPPEIKENKSLVELLEPIGDKLNILLDIPILQRFKGGIQPQVREEQLCGNWERGCTNMVKTKLCNHCYEAILGPH